MLVRFDDLDEHDNIRESFYEIDGKPVTQLQAIEYAFLNDQVHLLGPEEERILQDN